MFTAATVGPRGCRIGWDAFESGSWKHQLVLLEARVPLGQFVAASQSGTLGWCRDRVLSLGGRVNATVLGVAGTRHEYLAAREVHSFCDWELWYPHHVGGRPEDVGWSPAAEEGGTRAAASGQGLARRE